MQQCCTGQEGFGRPNFGASGGFPGGRGMAPPEGMERPGRGERPEGSGRPEGAGRSEGKGRPQFDGKGFDPSRMDAGFSGGPKETEADLSNAKDIFELTERVSSFSGVTDVQK